MMQHPSFTIPILAGLLWVVVFRLVCKLLGIPMPGRFRERPSALRALSFNQYACLLGALGWGFAMFVSSVADDYFRGPGFSARPASLLVLRLVGWLASGCLFGWMLWSGSRQDPPFPWCSCHLAVVKSPLHAKSPARVKWRVHNTYGELRGSFLRLNTIAVAHVQSSASRPKSSLSSYEPDSTAAKSFCEGQTELISLAQRRCCASRRKLSDSPLLLNLSLIGGALIPVGLSRNRFTGAQYLSGSALDVFDNRCKVGARAISRRPSVKFSTSPLTIAGTAGFHCKSWTWSVHPTLRLIVRCSPTFCRDLSS